MILVVRFEGEVAVVMVTVAGLCCAHPACVQDELARAGGGGVLGQSAINSMALPPVLAAGSEEMKREVARPVITGHKHICLAISEPGAGSDVANIATTAERRGDYYIVNGNKKWITGGLMAGLY